MKTKCVMHVCPLRGLYSPNVDVNVTHFESGLHDMQLTDVMRCSPSEVLIYMISYSMTKFTKVSQLFYYKIYQSSR